MLRTYYRQLDGDARAFGLGFLLLLPLYLAPLFVARYLPGLDLPFHLSMVDLLSKHGHASDPYREFYSGGFSVSPYMAHYAALELLSAFLPLMVAHKVVVGLYIAGFPLATAALLNACGRSRVPALLTFPLAYNLTLHYGFVSFALSLPVLMFLLAALTRYLTADENNRGWWTATAVVALLLFFCHLQNYLFGVCAVTAFVLFAGTPWRRRALALAALAPSVAALLFWNFTREFQGPGAAAKKSFAFAWKALREERISDLGGRTPLMDLRDRLFGIPVHALRGFTDNVDIVACQALLLVLGAYIALGCVAVAAPETGQPPPRMRLAGVVVLLGALAAYLGLPHHLHEFELMTFFPRFSVLVVAMGVLLVPAGLRRFDGVGRALLLLPALVMAGLYGQQLVRHYRFYDHEVQDFSAVVANVPPGGRALGLVFDRQSRVMRIESALVGLPALYPALRPGPSSMTSVLYCGMRHMPCQPTRSAKPIPDPGPWSPAAVSPSAIDFYDYIFLRSPPNRPIFGAAISRLEPIARQGTWVVYRRKPEPPSPAAPPHATTASGARPTSNAVTGPH